MEKTTPSESNWILRNRLNLIRNTPRFDLTQWLFWAILCGSHKCLSYSGIKTVTRRVPINTTCKYKIFYSKPMAIKFKMVIKFKTSTALIGETNKLQCIFDHNKATIFYSTRDTYVTKLCSNLQTFWYNRHSHKTFNKCLQNDTVLLPPGELFHKFSILSLLITFPITMTTLKTIQITKFRTNPYGSNEIFYEMRAPPTFNWTCVICFKLQEKKYSLRLIFRSTCFLSC